MILTRMYTDDRGQTRFAGEQVDNTLAFHLTQAPAAIGWSPWMGHTKKWSKPVESPQRTSFLETSGE
jgi:hypothetical protein